MLTPVMVKPYQMRHLKHEYLKLDYHPLFLSSLLYDKHLTQGLLYYSMIFMLFILYQSILLCISK